MSGAAPFQHATVSTTMNMDTLEEAVRNGDVETCVCLLQHKGPADLKNHSQYRTLLGVAAAHGHRETCRVLLDRGFAHCPDRHGMSPVHKAAKRGDAELCRLLISRGGTHDADEDGDTPLLSAAELGHAGACQVLLDSGAQHTPRPVSFTTPLHLAALSGHYDVCLVLASGGASPRARTCKGRTPLHLAAAQGHLKVCELLLDSGATHAAADSGLTPLHVAAAQRQAAVCRLLLDRGAQHGADNAGATPLLLASLSGCVRTCELLLARGARQTADVNGRTPMSVALMDGRLRCDAAPAGPRAPRNQRCGRHDLFRLLLQNYAASEPRREVLSTVNRLLRAAVTEANLHVSQLLIEVSAAEVTADDLCAAVERSHLQLVNLLLRHVRPAVLRASATLRALCCLADFWNGRVKTPAAVLAPIAQHCPALFSSLSMARFPRIQSCEELVFAVHAVLPYLARDCAIAVVYNELFLKMPNCTHSSMHDMHELFSVFMHEPWRRYGVQCCLGFSAGIELANERGEMVRVMWKRRRLGCETAPWAVWPSVLRYLYGTPAPWSSIAFWRSALQ